MSLKAFHVAFIFLSNLLTLGFGVWCLREASDTGDSMFTLLGALSLMAFVGLLVYGAWFLKKMRHLSYFVWAAMLFAGSNAMACPVCVGNPKSPMVISANLGITVLLAIITMVLIGFAGLFLTWRKREKAWMQAR